jgi:hypothetical protein
VPVRRGNRGIRNLLLVRRRQELEPADVHGSNGEDCLGPAACTTHVGPIGTLPWYYEDGLESDGDPALAFGPRPGPNGFSWATGSRLYYANLTSNINAKKDETFKQIWEDNASSSKFFGNVYVCWENFVGSSAPLFVATSRDGGSTWDPKKVTAAHAMAARHFGQSGCTVRTDSKGVVYVFYEEFQDPDKVGLPTTGTHFLVKSFDGGDVDEADGSIQRRRSVLRAELRRHVAAVRRRRRGRSSE